MDLHLVVFFSLHQIEGQILGERFRIKLGQGKGLGLRKVPFRVIHHHFIGDQRDLLLAWLEDNGVLLRFRQGIGDQDLVATDQPITR
ncbi:hypothetical protein D3C80_1808100 [compost metagenome]